MAPSTTRRMPLSCEPCRERKIRCPRRINDGSGPCGTCTRRGIPPSECIYLRDIIGRRNTRRIGESSSYQADNSELMERIARLERLLQSRVKTGTADAFEHSSLSHLPSPDSVLQSALYTESADGTSSFSNFPTRPSERLPYGVLRRTEAGYERYVPSVASSSSALWSNPMSRQLETEIDDYSKENEMPFSTTSKTTQDFLDTLPPVSQCDRLKGIYFAVFAPVRPVPFILCSILTLILQLFHILHDPTFEAAYSRFQANPDRVPLSWLALLFAVLSVSVMAVPDRDSLLQDLGRRKTTAENMSLLNARYRAAAMKCLEADHYLWRHNMHTLQTLIVLIYGINQTHGQSWALLGTAKNIALTLGCHVDPDVFDLDAVAAEERRRCWAGLNMLYTIQNTTLGHLDCSIPPSNVKTPLDIDDDQLSTGFPNSEPARSRPSQMSYLLLKFSLYDLCSRICRAVLQDSGARIPDAIKHLDSEITSQQDILNYKYLVDTADAPLPDYHAVHLKILVGYSHQLTLLLHRPALIHWVSSRGTLSHLNDDVALSRRRCIDSSRALIGIHKMLHEDDFYSPYRWYNRGLGSFHAFHAVVCLIYVLGASDDLDSTTRNLLQKDLDSALSVFEDIKQTGISTFCNRAAPIIRRLL